MMLSGKKVFINGVKIHHEVVGCGPHGLLLMPGALGEY